MTVINTNYSSIVAQMAMSATEKKLSSAMQQLSTGLKINSAADNAAGLAVANRMSSQIIGLTQANQNANDGINLIQTADGAANNITDITQKMRELAVQAANGSYTDAQRADADLEFQQLKNQIVSIASTTAWNGISIMDGTAGTNIGELPAIKNTSQYLFTSGPTLPVMKAGDLLVNGVNVGPSLGTDDLVSPADNAAASAIAKAAAINRVTNFANGTTQTGVTAVVNPNVFTGTAMTNTNVVTGGLVINGIHTQIFSTIANDPRVTRAMTIQAINRLTYVTGVTAVDSGTNEQGVSLVAKDGRNIEVQFDTSENASAFSHAIGIKQGDQSSTISLESKSSVPITLSYATNGNIANSGFQAQTFTKNQSIYNMPNRPVAQSGSPVLGLQPGDLVINGVPIRATTNSDDKSSSVGVRSSNSAASAIAISTAINESTSLTGVTAVAQSATIVGNSTTTDTAVSGSQTLFINGVGVDVNLTQGESIASRLTNVATAINKQAFETGVTASENTDSSALTLHSDGRNVATWFDSSIDGLSASSFGLGAFKQPTQISNISFSGDTPGQAVQASLKIDGFNVQAVASSSAKDTTLKLAAAIQNAINNGDLADIAVTTSGTNVQITSTVPGTVFTLGDVSFSGATNIGADITQTSKDQSTSNGVTGIPHANAYSSEAQTVYAGIQLISQNQTIPKSTDIEAIQDIPAPAPPTPIEISTGINGFNQISQFSNLGFQVGSFGGQAQSVPVTNQLGRVSFQVGADQNQIINIDLPNFGPNGSITGVLTSDAGLPNNLRTANIANQQNASDMITVIDKVIVNLSAYQSVMGAKMNRLTYTSDNLTTETTNLSLTESGIKDTNYASTSSDLAKFQIIKSAANAVLAQANTSQQSVLKLLSA
jgi:flagellin